MKYLLLTLSLLLFSCDQSELSQKEQVKLVDMPEWARYQELMGQTVRFEIPMHTRDKVYEVELEVFIVHKFEKNGEPVSEKTVLKNLKLESDGMRFHKYSFFAKRNYERFYKNLEFEFLEDYHPQKSHDLYVFEKAEIESYKMTVKTLGMKLIRDLESGQKIPWNTPTQVFKHTYDYTLTNRKDPEDVKHFKGVKNIFFKIKRAKNN